MSEELIWRTIPEFPGYEITESGDLRNKFSKNIINESESKSTGVWSYNLRRPDGSSTNRSFWSLVYSTWPELLDDWKQIPGHPMYLVNKAGKVMMVGQYRELTRNPKGFYRLRSGDAKPCWRESMVGDWDEFWEEEKAA